MKEDLSFTAGAFVLSLDFELMWGVKGSRTIKTYGANVLGVRSAVPRLLELFERNALGCTWATTGLLCFEDRDDLLSSLPEIRPAYKDAKLSTYSYLHEVGPDEERDPYHFGLSLVRQIAACPGQEIATHTFSHYYCQEDGHSPEAFSADLDAAVKIAARHGITFKSIVFPRNQVNREIFPICREHGITVFRGTGRMVQGGGTARSREGTLRRGLRFLDNYIDIGFEGPQSVERDGAMTDVPASLFLRPYARRTGPFDFLRLQRILNAMRQAARSGSLFHLWFHPHNFGANQDENFAILSAITDEAVRLRDAWGWPTLTMADAAARVSAHNAPEKPSVDRTLEKAATAPRGGP